MQQLISFAYHHRTLVLFGLLLTLFSSFGQTFLISLYIPEIETTFGLSNTALSSLYAAATMTSAFALPWVGRWIDYWPLRRFTMFVLIGYAVACIIFSIAFNPIIVLVGFFGLRFFGQGLMGHTSVSTMARAFESDRGKAISIATLGHPLGEVTLPLIVATGIALIGWRSTLQVSALSLLLLVLPISLYLLQNQSRDLLVPTGDQGSTEGKKSNPYLLLKNRTFWIIAPSVFMLGFLNTAIFFFQIKIGYSRGWEPSWVAASLSAYAVVNALSMLTSGPLVDKFSARRMFPFMMIPYCVGMLVLAFWTHPFSYPVALALFGASNGSGSTVRNALYAEVFGKDRIGAVRSFFSMVIVFSTALGPLSYGLLLDAGWTYASIFILSAALILATVIWSFRLSDQGE